MDSLTVAALLLAGFLSSSTSIQFETGKFDFAPLVVFAVREVWIWMPVNGCASEM